MGQESILSYLLKLPSLSSLRESFNLIALKSPL